jgi:ParB family transcriptional regulator, chromosome partitioning protein
VTPPPKQLGRGLSALLGDSNESAPTGAAARNAKMIPIASIRPGGFQPRTTFGPEELDELAASMRTHGVLQPILVRKDPKNPNAFELIAGERRWRAAQKAQLHEIPAVVREFSDREALEAALIENLQRADLSAIEEARAYARLMREFGHTQERLADALGKSRPYVANLVRLLGLPESIQDLVDQGKLSAGHARLLIESTEADAIARRWIADGISVREAETEIRGNRPAKTKPRASKSGKGREVLRDANTMDLERRLTASLGLKVAIQHQKGSQAGMVQISYQTLDQLDDIIVRLNKA